MIYQNKSAQKIGAPRGPSDSDGAPTRPSFPEVVTALHAEFKRSIDPEIGDFDGAPPIENRILSHEGTRYLLQSFPLRPERGRSDPTRLLILIEPISPSSTDGAGQSIKLTPREKGVVQLLLEGKTNKEVAVRMGIGEYTVKDHIKQIMKKLNVNTRAGVVSKIYRLNLHTGRQGSGKVESFERSFVT